MQEIPIPEDITKYQSKLLFGLTTRQFCFSVIGLLIGLPVFYLLKGYSMELAIMMLLLIGSPMFICGFVPVYGMPAEKFIKTAFISNFIAPKHRLYKIKNGYEEYFEMDKPKKLVKVNPRELRKNPDLRGYK